MRCRVISRTPAGTQRMDEFATVPAMIAALTGIAQIRTVIRVEGMYQDGAWLPYEETAIADAIGKAVKRLDVGIIRRD